MTSNAGAASLLTPSGRLLVFAHEDETHAFQDLPHLVTGIGKVSAAVELARVLATGDVRDVVVLGTAGLIVDGLNLDTVYRVNEAIQHDLEFQPPVAELDSSGRVSMRGSVPGRRMKTVIHDSGANLLQTGIMPSDPLPTDSAPTAVIATGDAFVTDDSLRSDLAGRGASLVDMESYAYASVGAAFRVPLRIFKVPSDFADSGTTDETWDQIVARKSEQLREFAEKTRLI